MINVPAAAEENSNTAAVGGKYKYMFKHKDVIKILSIDGGGIRGIIPAILLTEIEKATGKKICKLFDFFAGTSTGGFLSLLLNIPNPIPAAEAIKIYGGSDGKKIFKKHFLTPLNNIFKGPKYDKSGTEGVFSEKFGNTYLRDVQKPVFITAYETEQPKVTFFRNYDYRYKDLYIKDVARAACAAPTYFEPLKLHGRGTFIDACLIANSPAMSAYAEVIKLLKEEGIDPNSKKIIVVSLGTGITANSYSFDEIKKWTLIDWLKGPLLPLIFDENSNTVEAQLKQVLNPDCYYRFQLRLPNEKSYYSIDNTDYDNLDKLCKLTSTYINNDIIEELPTGWASKLNNLCESINNSTTEL